MLPVDRNGLLAPKYSELTLNVGLLASAWSFTSLKLKLFLMF